MEDNQTGYVKNNQFKVVSSIKCERCGKEAHHNHCKDRNHKNKDPNNYEDLCTLCHSKEHGIEPQYSEIRKWVVYYSRIQKQKIGLENVIRNLSRIELIIPDDLIEMVKKLEMLEGRYWEEIRNYFKENRTELNKWLLSVSGINFVLAGKVLSYFLNFKGQKVSSLWQYAGYAPGCKPKKGEKIHYTPQFRVYLRQVADSFILKRTLRYREIYDKEKEKRLAQGKVKNHAHKLAIRKMMKTFLKDLYKKAKEDNQFRVVKNNQADYVSSFADIN